MRIVRVLVCLLVLASPAFGNDLERKITVTGSSEITLDPQYSIIHTELRYVHPEITTSYQNLQQTLSEIIKALSKLGITDKEITKSIIRQGSEYTWRNNARAHAGFYSSCSMQIRVNKIEKIHLVYNHLSKYNSLSITSTGYGRNDTDNLRNQELTKALYAARTKAELMVQGLGVTVGDILTITESGQRSGPPPVALMRGDAAPQKPGGTFGSVTIAALVVVEFTLE